MKNRSVSAWLAAASVALWALGSSGAAQARSNVYWSAGVAVPGVVVSVGNGYSVYTTPAPTYYAPPPAYYPPPAGYYAPPPVYYAPPPPPPAYGYGYYRGAGRHAVIEALGGGRRGRRGHRCGQHPQTCTGKG